jgi:hypothetical protein
MASKVRRVELGGNRVAAIGPSVLFFVAFFVCFDIL